ILVPPATHASILILLFSLLFTAPPPTEIYTLSLHDALPISALVANRSGVGFSDARLTLVAGSPNRAGGGASPQFFKVTGSRAAAAPMAEAAMPSERRSGEYHAYELADPIPIANGATERVPLFPPQAAVACQRDYVV